MAYFVRGQTGNNGNAGTSGATARQTHAGIAALAPAASSVINHAERQDAVASATFSAAGLTFKNEDGSGGASPAQLRGVQYPVWNAPGTFGATRSYRANVGAISVARVVDRYLSRIDSNGLPRAFLAEAASAAAVDTAGTGANTWFHDGATWLYVQLNDGTDPTTLTGDNRVGYVLANAGAMIATGGRALMQDMKSELVAPKGTNAGYQFQFDNGNNVARRLYGVSGGVHNAVFLTANNDLIEDSEFSGCGQLSSGAESNNCLGFFSSVADVVGCVSRRNVFRCYTFLGPTGAPINASAACSGIIVHTDDATGATRGVKDFQSEDDWSIHYGQNGQLLDVAGTKPIIPTSILNPRTYPARVVRGGQRASRGIVHDATVSYVNTFFDMTAFAGSGLVHAVWLFNGRSGAITALSATNPAVATSVGHKLSNGDVVSTAGLGLTSGSANGSFPITVVDADHFSIPVDATAGVPDGVGTWVWDRRVVAFVGCTFVFDQGNQAGADMFRLQPNVTLVLIECDVINRGLITAGPHTFFTLSDATNKIICHRSNLYNAVATPSSTRLVNEAGGGAAALDFQGNNYFGLAVNAWGTDPTRDTQSEWLDPNTGVDKTGTYADPMFVNPQSTDPLIAGKLAPGSPLLVPTRKIIVPGLLDVGINGRYNDGTVGSWKYGNPAPISGNRLSRVLRV